MGSTPNFQGIRKRTIQQRNQQLERFIPIFQDIIKKSKFSSERIEYITRIDLVRLVTELNKREITSEQLVAIFGERAATIGLKNCIITEDYFQYALKRAKQCDYERSKTNKRNWTMQDEWDMSQFFPPLFGIPISIKDNIQMEGTRATVGLTIRADRIHTEDCATIKCLKYAGLIPFMKTNVPQLAFNFDSYNFLWGRTQNPWNPNKSAGGSSGGQGAAVAFGISPVGLANDMGGSIRIPSAFNGVIGLLPSADRLPFQGQITKYSTGFTGMDHVMCSNGPISTSVDSIALWMRQMTTEQFYLGEHDPYKKLIPFDIKIYKSISEGKRKLKIGYLEGYKLIEPTPAVKRAVRQTAAFLKSQGHEVVQIQIPNETQLLMCLFPEALGQGQFKSFEAMLEGQPLVEEYSQLSFLVNRGWCLFNCIKCIMQKKYPRLGMVIEAGQKISTHQYLLNVGRIHQLRQEWIKFWRTQKLDFVVLPTFASEATPHGTSKNGFLLCTYTYLWNILKMTSCTQPITLTRQDQLYYQSVWEDPVTQLIKKNIQDGAGLPVSIQVIGLPFHQERVLGLSKRIESHFQFSQKHPIPRGKSNTNPQTYQIPPNTTTIMIT